MSREGAIMKRVDLRTRRAIINLRGTPDRLPEEPPPADIGYQISDARYAPLPPDTWQAPREGADDYLRVPSLISGQRVYRQVVAA
jgi:hypothetical protein